MKIALLIIFVFFIYKYLHARYVFGRIQEQITFYLYKIELEINEQPDNPMLYCRRGSLYQKLQDFPKAYDDFRHALSLIDEGWPIPEKEKILSKLALNIRFTQKPLPWSKNGPMDHSGNAFYYFLIERFGDMRYQFKN